MDEPKFLHSDSGCLIETTGDMDECRDQLEVVALAQERKW